ncbi:MAG: hypothetical protein ACRC33_32105 [Gemmataceae bacterium]
MAEKIKFKVTLEKLSFEYEGTREVGQALQAGLSRSLANLVDTQRTAMLPAPPVPVHEMSNGNGDGPSPVVIDQSPRPVQKPKKSRKMTGVSHIGLLRGLKAEGYFGEPRPVEMLREKLKEKGHTLKDSLISARLLDMIQKDELHRKQEGGSWLYKDKPFDESPGTANASEDAAE